MTCGGFERYPNDHPEARRELAEMERDPSRIPPGEFCYRVLPLRDGERLTGDIAEYGRSVREFAYHQGFKAVLCPYWERTDYGTVKRLLTGKEVLDTERDYEKSLALLSARLGPVAANAFPTSWKLADEIKICGINTDREGPW